MSEKKKTTITAAILISTVVLSGCGLLGGEKNEKIDPPQSVTYTQEGGSDEIVETQGSDLEVNENGEAVGNSVMTELYLIDKNGYVVPRTIPLPYTTSVATQALKYLVKGGPVTELIPNDFKAVLPTDTELSVDIDDGIATVDFSKEFKNYDPNDERKILEAITWTLTQFDTVDEVKLTLNGNELSEMPVNGTPIGNGLTRADGINMDTSDIVDIANTKALTVYYIAGDEEDYYYVPVTRRVSNEVKNNVEGVVRELVNGPSYTSNLLSDFMSDVELIEEPELADGTVTLNFNEFIYGSFEEKTISQHILNTLVLSLTEQEGIESVAVLVNGEAELVNENGEKLTEPVTRPENVNTGSF